VAAVCVGPSLLSSLLQIISITLGSLLASATRNYTTTNHIPLAHLKESNVEPLPTERGCWSIICENDLKRIAIAHFGISYLLTF
jgi:hypothetical protein